MVSLQNNNIQNNYASAGQPMVNSLGQQYIVLNGAGNQPLGVLVNVPQVPVSTPTQTAYGQQQPPTSPTQTYGQVYDNSALMASLNSQIPTNHADASQNIAMLDYLIKTNAASLQSAQAQAQMGHYSQHQVQHQTQVSCSSSSQPSFTPTTTYVSSTSHQPNASYHQIQNATATSPIKLEENAPSQFKNYQTSVGGIPVSYGQSFCGPSLSRQSSGKNETNTYASLLSRFG